MNTVYKQGDIVWMRFEGTVGHEQKGIRPALVVSSDNYNKLMQLYIVCPISTNTKNFPSHFLLPNNLNVTGAVLCEHMRTVDLNKRKAEKVCRCPKYVLNEVVREIKKFY